MKAIKKIVLFILVAIQIAGCTSYKSQYVAFRPPEAYSNMQQSGGISIGGASFANSDLASEAFGFDILATGLLPVQLVIENKSGRQLQIVTDQTFLIDKYGGYWQVVPNNVAINRVEGSTQLAALGRGAGKGALMGAAGGALLGAAVGIVTGQNVGNAVGKGAVIGGVGGAAVGTASTATSTDRQVAILNDIRSKGLEGKAIPTEFLSNGFLFFPAEAKTTSGIRIQIRELEGGQVHNLQLNL
ncbi:MAG: glycine zipper family protein [Geobacteraceae bacterium]|nr:glycine zipper family protein [Geobacteraceae bacterium]